VCVCVCVSSMVVIIVCRVCFFCYPRSCCRRVWDNYTRIIIVITMLVYLEREREIVVCFYYALYTKLYKTLHTLSCIKCVVVVVCRSPMKSPITSLTFRFSAVSEVFGISKNFDDDENRPRPFQQGTWFRISIFFSYVAKIVYMIYSSL